MAARATSRQRRERTGRTGRIGLILVAAVAAAILALGALRVAGEDEPAPIAAPPVRAVHGWTSSACGADEPAPIRHIVWIWLENRAYAEVVAPHSRFTFLREQVMRDCATLTAMSAEQHSSLGNYIAATTGSADGISGGCPPSECPIDRPSLLGQVSESGREWRSYQQGLTRRCQSRDLGNYLVRHDPAPYLVREHADCLRWDVPLGSVAVGPLARALDDDALPSFALITPDACEGGHDCVDTRADAWLRRWLTKITTSAAYDDGDVAVFVMWDEGRRAAADVPINARCPAGRLRDDCHIATFVIAPGVPRGTRIDTTADHVTLLQLTEAMLDLPTLGPPRPEAVAIGRELRLVGDAG